MTKAEKALEAAKNTLKGNKCSIDWFDMHQTITLKFKDIHDYEFFLRFLLYDPEYLINDK